VPAALALSSLALRQVDAIVVGGESIARTYTGAAAERATAPLRAPVVRPLNFGVGCDVKSRK
jgi:hypothetical protein